MVETTTTTKKNSVAGSGDDHTESELPGEMKMCQTEYGKGIEGEGGACRKQDIGRVGFVLLPAFQSPDIVLDAC
jgi:hypothetical protein